MLLERARSERPVFCAEEDLRCRIADRTNLYLASWASDEAMIAPP